MSQPTELMLALKDVCLTYNRGGSFFKQASNPVLQDINIELRRGEVLGIIGRNGCGKSSLLRIMSGIMDPSDGKVTVPPNIHRAVLAIGLGFRPDLTGRDNAYLSSILQGSSRAVARTSLEKIKKFSELGDAFEDPVRTYSSGMQSRLGFSTSLISHVDILFIDEVLSVGDGHFQKKALAAITEKISGDQTVVFVSHSSSQVADICGRVVWLENGAIRLMGAAKETVQAYEESL